MKAKQLFENAASKTHMPFVSGDTFLFCVSDRLAKRGPKGNADGVPFRPWNLARASMTRREIKPVDTGLPEDTVICSPAFYRENDLIHVSFIAGVPEEGAVRYNLYAMSGPSFDELSAPKAVSEQSARIGFVSPTHFCLGGRNRLTLLCRKTKRQQILTTSLHRIVRATFDASNPDRLLVTGIDDWGDRVTLLHNMTTDETREISVDGPIYKSSLDGERVVFAHRESEDVEDYQLRVSEYELIETPETVTVESR